MCFCFLETSHNIFLVFPITPIEYHKKINTKNQHRFLCSIKSLDGTFIIIEFMFHFTLGGSLFWYLPYMNNPPKKERGYYMYLQKVGGGGGGGGKFFFILNQ